MPKVTEAPPRSGSAIQTDTDADRRHARRSAGAERSRPMPAEDPSDPDFDQTHGQGSEPVLESML